MICQCLNSQQICDYCYYNYSGKSASNESLNQIKQTQEMMSGYSNYSCQSSSTGNTSQHIAIDKNLLFPSYNSSCIKQKGLLSPAFSQPCSGGNNSINSLFWKPILPNQRYSQATTTNKFQEYFPVSPATSMHSMDSLHETRFIPSPISITDFKLAAEVPTSFTSSSSMVDFLLCQNDKSLVPRSQQQKYQPPSKEYSRLLYHHQYQNYQNSKQQYYENNLTSYNDQHQRSGLLQHENLLACAPKTFKEPMPRKSQTTIPSSNLVSFKVYNNSVTAADPLLTVKDTGFFGEHFQEDEKNFSGSSSGGGGGGGEFKKEPVQLQCPTCFKMFSRPYNLKSHQNSHSKEKPFVCSYGECSWKFSRSHDLKRHEQCIHTDIRPHKCNCGRRFARSDALKRHLNIDPVCKKATK